MKKISIAANGLSKWLVNMLKFNDVYINIEPIIKNKEKLEVELNKAI